MTDKVVVTQADIEGLIERLRSFAAMLVHANALSLKPKASNEVETTMITTTESNLMWAALSETAAALSRLEAEKRELVEALRKAEAGMTCRRDDDAHYCPNCDNTTFDAREAVRSTLSKLGDHP